MHLNVNGRRYRSSFLSKRRMVVGQQKKIYWLLCVCLRFNAEGNNYCKQQISNIIACSKCYSIVCKVHTLLLDYKIVTWLLPRHIKINVIGIIIIFYPPPTKKQTKPKIAFLFCYGFYRHLLLLLSHIIHIITMYEL